MVHDGAISGSHFDIMNVAVLDYGIGNIHSLVKALEAGGARVGVETDAARAVRYEALVLPGVGAFGAAAGVLAPVAPALRAAIAGGLPCLGICLGMQLLFDTSEEGLGMGLGVMPGHVRRMRARRVPHMGWNTFERPTHDPIFFEPRRQHCLLRKQLCRGTVECRRCDRGYRVQRRAFCCGRAPRSHMGCSVPPRKERHNRPAVPPQLSSAGRLLIVFAAIDLRDSNVVQLVGGDPADERIRWRDPVAVAQRWVSSGFEQLHIVDLDAALGSGNNRAIIGDIIRAVTVPVQVGGGVRTDEIADELFEAGAARVIVGTRAVREPEWLEHLAARYPERIVLAADVRERNVVIAGLDRRRRYYH